MPILGLTGTENYAAQRYKSVRRMIFYDLPNGAAPLTGLTSLLKEDRCHDPEFEWTEKRILQQRCEINGTDVIQTSAGGAVANGSNLTAGTRYRLLMDNDITNVRRGHLFKIDGLTKNGGGTYTLKGRITGGSTLGDNNDITATDTYVFFTPLVTLTAVYNTANVDNTEVLIIGSAFAQGATGSSKAPHTLPIFPQNYCQIMRTEFAVSRTALKTPVKFDKEGVYKDKSYEASIQHMIELEKSFLFGVKSKDAATDLPTYTTGGIIYHLEQWELGTPYGVTPSTLNTDDNKRIIDIGGVITDKDYDKYLERIFRVTMNQANEKLVLCGSGFLSVINQLYKSKGVLNTNLPMTDTYGMDVTSHRTPFGTIYYKSHPLFSQNAGMRFNALFLDTGNLVYRYVDDTDLYENRQANNADHRMDEWLTECGLECRFPETHMYMQNVLDYAP